VQHSVELLVESSGVNYTPGTKRAHGQRAAIWQERTFLPSCCVFDLT